MFLYTVLYGAGFCIGYDLIRAFRRTLKHRKILIAAEDLVFWLVIGIFLFTRIYAWNDGILRWYFFAGLFLGFLIYAVTISSYVVEIVSFFLKRLKMFFLWVNILVKRVVQSFFEILGIRNGKNVKSEEEKTPGQKGNTAE